MVLGVSFDSTINFILKVKKKKKKKRALKCKLSLARFVFPTNYIIQVKFLFDLIACQFL